MLSKIVTIFEKCKLALFSALNVPKDEKKTFRQSGLLIIDESRDQAACLQCEAWVHVQGDSYKFHFVFISF